MPKSPYENILKNAKIALTGDAGAGLLEMFSLFIITKTIGAGLFGIYTLVQSFFEIINRLIGFQTNQAFIKFATDAIAENNRNKFIQVLKFCFSIDIITTIIALIIALISVPLFMSFFDINNEYTPIIILFSFSLLASTMEVSTGIFRVFDTFRLQAKANLYSYLLKATLFTTLFFIQSSISHFFIATLTSVLFGAGVRLYFMNNLLNKNGYSFNEIFRTKINLKELKQLNIISFVMYTNFNQSIRVITRQIDILLIGKLISNEAIAVYKVAIQLAQSISKLCDPIYQAIYPEMAVLFFKKQFLEAKNIAFKISKYIGIASAALYLGVYLFGEFFISLVFGSQFIESHSVLLVILLGTLMAVIGSPVAPILYSNGHAKSNFIIHVYATVIYLISLYPLVLKWNIYGAAIGIIIFHVIWAISSIITIKKKRIFQEQ